MGCKCCKRNQLSPVIEPVRVVRHEPISHSNDSIRESKKRKHEASLNDDQITGSQNDVNFVEIEVSDPEAFNNSFIQQRQRVIDNQYYRSTIESWRPTSLSQLVDFIKALSKDKSLIDCHWIIFYWITCNIEYDTVSYFTKNYADQSAEGVFRTKKGVCAGYANIYKYLCDQLNISCEEVSGYSKGYGFDEREDVFKETDHAWNAIEIDHHWYLIESTWGSGRLTDQKIFQHELNSYYFCPRPNEMIYHHLPENEKWQLLRLPIKKTQYMQMPKIQPIYFELNLELINPRHQAHVDLLPNESYALVEIRAPSNVHLIADLKLHEKKIEGGHHVIFDKKKQFYCCYFAPNTIGKHKITIYGKQGETEIGTHHAAIDLTLDIKQMPKNPISFPKTWQLFHDLDLKIEAPRDRAVAVWPENASFSEIRISAPDDIQLSCSIKYNGVDEQNCALAQFDNDKQQWQLLFAPQCTGVHKILIYARRQSDTKTTSSPVVEFDLNVTKLRKPMKFPLTYLTFQTNKCRIYEPLNGVLKKDAIVPIHCFIPGATAVDLKVDSKWLDIKGYEDPILNTEVTVGSTDVIICAKYEQNTNYDRLVRYSVGL